MRRHRKGRSVSRLATPLLGDPFSRGVVRKVGVVQSRWPNLETSQAPQMLVHGADYCTLQFSQS